MDLPIATRFSTEEQFGTVIPEPDGFIAWWAPQVEEDGPPFLFSINRAEKGLLRRYPHMGIYAAENTEDEDNESVSQSASN